MKLSTIESAANRTGLAGADFDLHFTLKYVVIPAFLLDVDQQVGQVFWRRNDLTLTIQAGEREADLPADFGRFSVLMGWDGGSPIEFTSLDESDSQAVISEFLATESPVRFPASYRIVRSSTLSGSPPALTPNLFAVRFIRPFLSTTTIRGIYYWTIRSASAPGEDTDLDLDAYIPPEFQPPLIELLRAEILKDRYDIKDKRFTDQMAMYQSWISRMTTVWKTQSPKGQTATYVR